MESKFKALGDSANVLLVNIEGGTGACGPFNDKHSLTLPHYGLKDKGQIAPFGVQYIPHHVAIAADGTVQESPSQDAFGKLGL
jgi:hypothetical protein|eukprot:COSAG02_NODE_7640_length_2920_cov_5.152074_3_plen_83_part_00